jgi:hypothetical protein
MLSLLWKFFAVALCLTLIPRSGFAEQIVVPGSTQPNAREVPYPKHPIVRSSGCIFAGTVQSVQRVAPNEDSVATVIVSFHVDQGIRGVHTGQTLSVREWAGLWQSGPRYRPGERVLLFLYPVSKLGLTSPVGGELGRFAIGTDGRIPIDPRRVNLRRHASVVHGQGNTRLTPRDFVRFAQIAENE